jgi:hypothetical protein
MMKLKTFFGKTLVVVTMFALFGCGSAPAPAQTASEVSSGVAGIDLDAAIREAAAQMEANLPAQTKVALVSFASTSAQLSEYVISRLEAALVGGKKLVVVDRANLDKVREEQGFQLSGEVDDDSAKAIGRLLGAGAIVTGAFSDLGDVYSLTLKAINIESATVASSYPADITRSARIRTMLAAGGGAAGTQPARTANTPPAATPPAAVPVAVPVAAPPAPAAPETPPAPAVVYNIGDTGPAGGLIFYDKGSYSQGWRYLEAAPATTEITAQWRFNSGVLGSGVSDVIGATSKEVGMGQINTQTIMRHFSQNGGGFGLAVQVCDELAVNGFDDWFLPSQDELSYMYGNLYRRGLGGFRNEWYWSSTIISGNYTDASYAPSRINFANGEPASGESAVNRRVRAIRQF